MEVSGREKNTTAALPTAFVGTHGWSVLLLKCYDGHGMTMPEGAFPEGTTVKLKISEATLAEAMPLEPDLPGFHFGSAIKIDSEGWDGPLPEGRDIDVSFPRPDFSVLPESERPTKVEDVHD